MMNDFPLLGAMQSQVALKSTPGEVCPPPAQCSAGWVTATLHWLDIDAAVDNILEGLVSALSSFSREGARDDRDTVLELAEEAVRLNRLARAAEVAQEASKRDS